MDFSRILWGVSATSPVEMKGEKKIKGGRGRKNALSEYTKKERASEKHKSADQETFESQNFCMNA